ncbi:MAG TPA: CvpA family protein [Bacteroidota bacterium]
MLLDLILLCPLILYPLLGLRDGLVRKLVSIVAIIVALFLGQGYMRDVGQFLIENLGTSPGSAPAMGFFTIFVFVTLIASIIYRVASDNYKIGGIADKVLGTVMGFVQGVLIASSLLLMMAFQGMPSRNTARDSRLYKPLVNIAPQILDLGAEIGPETVKHIDSLTKPEDQKKE